jgi:hypothetical protein
MVLDALCPEAFHSDAPIHFRTGEEGANEEAATIYAIVRAKMNGIEVQAEHTFRESFTDTDGGKGMLVSLYEPKR